MAQGAAPKEVANSELRRMLAQRKPFNCDDLQVGDSSLFYEDLNRRSAPRRRGSAKILKIDDAGATAKFQSQTFEVAQYCVRKKVDMQDVGEVGWEAASGGSGSLGKNREDGRFSERVGDPNAGGTTSQCGQSDVRGVSGSAPPPPGYFSGTMISIFVRSGTIDSLPFVPASTKEFVFRRELRTAPITAGRPSELRHLELR